MHWRVKPPAVGTCLQLLLYECRIDIPTCPAVEKTGFACSYNIGLALALNVNVEQDLIPRFYANQAQCEMNRCRA